MRKLVWTVLGAIALTACSGGGDDSPDSTVPPAPPGSSCTTPVPAAAVDRSLVIALPSDSDASAMPAASTEIFFSVLTPAHCPGETFPLVLHSHGYGGKRLRTLAPNGDLHPDALHFESIDRLAQALPYHGYVVISFDQRGHGQSTNAGARIIDPALETRDASALLDWAYDHSAEYAIQREAGSIAKDLKVGTLGYSYGGGFQLPLAALDARIDTIVPNGTWHNLLYSLLPGDAMKLGYGGLLCVLALTGGVDNTPIVKTLCNTIGPLGLGAFNQRSRADLVRAIGRPLALPRPVNEDELVQLFSTHGMGYFRNRQAANQPWGFGESSARLRAVPALFLQGNRDVLFNLTEAYWNYRYFKAAGGDVRLLSTEGGHMNPLANQLEGTADCGAVSGVASVLGWFDHHLKGAASAAYEALPEHVCLSIADTTGAPAAAAGVELAEIPVGSLSGSGAVPAILANATATLASAAIAPEFVPVVTISGNDKVLAGVPSLGTLSVARGALASIGQSTNAFVGVGIRRGSATILVDDQLSAFTEGEHTGNRNVDEGDAILLPAVGEKLQDGDQVGLLFYPQHIQYAAIVSAEGVSGLTGLVNFIGNTQIPPVTSALEPVLGLLYNNPYDVGVTDVRLPILVPGRFSGSRLRP